MASVVAATSASASGGSVSPQKPLGGGLTDTILSTISQVDMPTTGSSVFVQILAVTALVLLSTTANAQDGSRSESWGEELMTSSLAGSSASSPVSASLSFPVAFSATEHDADAFRASIIAWLAAAAGVPPSSIQISEVKSGSIIVTFVLSSTLGGGRTSVSALAALEAALLAGTVPALTHNGVTYPHPTLTVVLAPSVLCDLSDVNCGVGRAGSRYHIDWNQVQRLATQDRKVAETRTTLP